MIRRVCIIDEIILIENIKNGNEKAFETLINNYKNYIYTICYGIIKNHEEALDISQEVFIKVYFSILSYKNQGFKSWISKIAINTSIDYHRKLKNIQKLIPIDGDNEDLFSSYDDIEENVINNFDLNKLSKLYKSLPEKYYKILKKYYFENKSYSCISLEENISIKTVETRLYRARKMLKERWEDR